MHPFKVYSIKERPTTLLAPQGCAIYLPGESPNEDATGALPGRETRHFAFNPAITSGSSCFTALQLFRYYDKNEGLPHTMTNSVGFREVMGAEQKFYEHRKPPAKSIGQFDIAPVVESGRDLLGAVKALLNDLTKAMESYAWYWKWVRKIEKNYNKLFSETETLLDWIANFADLGISAQKQLREENGAEYEKTQTQAVVCPTSLIPATAEGDRIVYMESVVQSGETSFPHTYHLLMTMIIYHVVALQEWTTQTSRNMFQPDSDTDISKLHPSVHPYFGPYSDILGSALEETQTAFSTRQFSSLQSTRHSLYNIGEEHSILEDPFYFVLVEAN
ncbi:hypothetical protein FRB96_008622 [Tulasnella sp. 330]|nr:hypothetical protein FRB96_008622 [Tulasnella sp. 330]